LLSNHVLHGLLVAAGGVLGAKGGCWLAVTEPKERLDKITSVIDVIEKEPDFK